MSDEHAPPDFARQNGWDRQYNVFVPPEIPNYVGGVSVSNYETLINAGADRLVVGSGYKELWQKLQTKK
jgi:hypothetical protein